MYEQIPASTPLHAASHSRLFAFARTGQDKTKVPHTETREVDAKKSGNIDSASRAAPAFPRLPPTQATTNQPLKLRHSSMFGKYTNGGQTHKTEIQCCKKKKKK